jgi:endonuclease-8
MPEGDTIHRAVASLRSALGHGLITSLDAPGVRGPHPEPGTRIDAIEAHGKHLLVRFEGNVTLHTHLGMSGSWRIERPAAPSRRPPPRHAAPRPGRLTARVETATAGASCRNAGTVELLDATALRRHPVLSTLGPDLCLPDPDLDEALRRLDTLVDPFTPVGIALLDQRPASGIGNVYRSETLWACRVDPFVPLADLDRSTRRALYETAGELLRRNLRGWPRRTVAEGLAVYDRAGHRCRRCRETVVVRRLGEHARIVWWCPGCQGSPGSRASRASERVAER